MNHPPPPPRRPLHPIAQAVLGRLAQGAARAGARAAEALTEAAADEAEVLVDEVASKVMDFRDRFKSRRRNRR